MKRNKVIETPCGKVSGHEFNEKVDVYKGIRYARANRFEYPIEVTKWDGVYDALEYGACSYQPRAFYNEEENLKKIFYYNEFRKNRTYEYSEDCLFLNIWTPKDSKKGDNLPVLIYIHGGGFTGGCGHEAHFDGPIWPSKGIIGVTINYRLGPLGFVCFEGENHSGNYGLYDQVCAINWIKHNIASFGGDPNNISIMGQSAGAMSVQQLCLSPLTKGLFQKAIMNSGGGISKILNPPPQKKRHDFSKKMMTLAGCNNLEDLKKVDIETLFKAYNEAKKGIFGMACLPVIDGELIVDESSKICKNNMQHHIPYMIGSTSEDMMPPFMYSMAKKWGLSQDTPTYCYMFNHKLPGDDNGAWHSSDLWYFFGTLGNSWRPMGEIDYSLSDVMNNYLANFVKTGDPNGNGLEKWNEIKKSEGKLMHFGNGVCKEKKVDKSILWKNLFFKKSVGE